MTAAIIAPPARWTAEHRFYVGIALAMCVVVYVGFARSFFLRPWFPQHPAAHEPIFLVHGVAFTAWCVLLLVQPTLVAAGRVDLHRKLGAFGAVLAAAMVVLGLAGALVAANRPTGFTGLPVPPLQFLIVPFTDMLLFATFVALVVWDLRSRGRLHPATLAGGLAIMVSQPLRLALSGSAAWLAFAAWVAGLAR